MIKFKWVLLLTITIGFVSCSKDDDLVDEIIDNSKSVVINELLPKNSENGSDQDGEYDDWIELYNTSAEDLDISGYYLSDSKSDVTKWKFPVGTTIEKNSYLIVWADGDTTQTGLHTNYKLSADGENVVLLTPERDVINLVEYPPTVIEQSWTRIPDATGDFKWSTPTFNQSNE